MDEFDPIPPVNPVFKGVVVAALILCLALTVYGLVGVIASVLIRGWQ